MFPTADTENISQVTSLFRNSSPSDEQASTESSEVAKQNNNRELTLNMLVKELVFCIALALTTYGALHNTHTKISKVPQAVRFFHSDSIVSDWYRGQLGNALSAINAEDVSFVMYYAPWDAESQYVRGEFEKAANVLGDRVHFSAINCWNPGSECRLQHNKIPSWPILMVYTVTSKGVLYKGPKNAESMINFLELIMRPLEKVSNTEDLVSLLSICDAVAVGFTPLIETSRYYNVWYNVALKAREFDTVGEVCFAAVTSFDLAVELGVESVPNARLMLWNETKEYKPVDNHQSWNETYLMHWALQNFVQPVDRIIPLWHKSYNFETYADGNPILILFTPLNPLYEQLPSYSLLREIAMEYKNCNNSESSQWTTELIKLQKVQRLLYQQKDFMKFCQQYKFKKPAKKISTYPKKDIISHNNKYPWNNATTKKNKKRRVFNFLFKQGLGISKLIETSKSSDDSALWSTLDFPEQCGSATLLPAEKSFYDNYEKCQSIEENLSSENLKVEQDTATSMLPSEDDPLSSENLLQDNIKHFCRVMQFANKVNPPVLPSKVSNITHIRGLACSTNYSFHMLAIDSIRNYHFAESLGINITSKKDNTAVVILDTKHETQYVLSEDYSAKSVRDFIQNFTQKKLKRTLRSLGQATHTHHFTPEKYNQSVQIVDLTTQTFKKTVRRPGVVSIVAVCGGGCSAHTSRALAAAARVLASCGVYILAARLDALRHDLPWHYTVHTYPTIMVFSENGGRETDSRAFPNGERVSSSGVVALALRSLDVPRQMRARLALCTLPQTMAEKKACLKDMKENIVTMIGRNLKYWRYTSVMELKELLFKRLQHLHHLSLHLHLIHISDLKEKNKKQELLLQFVDNMSRDWNIDVSFLSKSTIPSPITR